MRKTDKKSAEQIEFEKWLAKEIAQRNLRIKRLTTYRDKLLSGTEGLMPNLLPDIWRRYQQDVNSDAVFMTQSGFTHAVTGAVEDWPKLTLIPEHRASRLSLAAYVNGCAQGLQQLTDEFERGQRTKFGASLGDRKGTVPQQNHAQQVVRKGEADQ